jgi:hypothetical protein
MRPRCLLPDKPDRAPLFFKAVGWTNTGDLAGCSTAGDSEDR